MELVHHNRSKPALKQVPSPSPSSIDEIGVTPMRFSHRQPQTISSRRSENEVNMIGHESVRPHLDSGLTGLLSQQVSINLLVAVLEKDRLATIPTLRNVMWKADNH